MANHSWRYHSDYAAHCGNSQPGDALADRDEDVTCKDCLGIVQAVKEFRAAAPSEPEQRAA